MTVLKARRKHEARSSLWLGLSLGAIVLLWALPSWAFLTDMTTHTEPALPSLPAANAKITDPVFGSTVVRLTDSADSSTACQTFYSNMPSMNVNNTKIAAQCRVSIMRTKVWDFNPATLAVSNGRLQSNEPTGAQGYFTQWSRTTYNKFTICAQMTLVEVTIPDGSSTIWTNTVLHDFTADFPSATYVTQHSVSNDDDVFALMSNNGWYGVWKRSTNTMLLKVNYGAGLNEVEIDKSGRYLVALGSGTDLSVWDVQATPSPTQTAVISTLFFNHRAIGYGVVGANCNTQRLCARSLATPNTVTYLLPTNMWPYSIQDDHRAIPRNSDAWMVNSRFNTNGQAVSAPFDQEIVLSAMDGSNTVRRIAHHRSVILSNDYNSMPKASVSADGNYITFTSNWGTGGGRLDLYLAVVGAGSTHGCQ